MAKSLEDTINALPLERQQKIAQRTAELIADYEQRPRSAGVLPSIRQVMAKLYHAVFHFRLSGLRIKDQTL